MWALLWNNELHLAGIPVPELLQWEALIRSLLAGICATDVHITRGYRASQVVLDINRRHAAIADYFTLPTANLHSVPDDLSDELEPGD